MINDKTLLKFPTTLREKTALIFIKACLKSRLSNEKASGIMIISSSVENLFNEKQVESMKIIANQIAISLEKVNLYKKYSRYR